jgi:NADH-quinone oxidoreductase subunit D
MLRGSGAPWDLRKKQPYAVYDRMDFDIPVGVTGDCYDRYLVRVEEMRQSIRILKQAIAKLPDGPIIVEDHRVALPPKRDAYNTIESMIRHFKHIMDGVRVPAGEGYAFVEGGNGELGFFVIGDGTGRPYKAYCRSPSFVHLSTASQLIHGRWIADVVPIFGMINMIGGECDK